MYYRNFKKLRPLELNDTIGPGIAARLLYTSATTLKRAAREGVVKSYSKITSRVDGESQYSVWNLVDTALKLSWMLDTSMLTAAAKDYYDAKNRSVNAAERPNQSTSSDDIWTEGEWKVSSSESIA